MASGEEGIPLKPVRLQANDSRETTHKERHSTSHISSQKSVSWHIWSPEGGVCNQAMEKHNPSIMYLWKTRGYWLLECLYVRDHWES